MARPPIMHRRTPAAAVALLLGLAGAGVLLLLMGVGRPGAQFLGVPMGGGEKRPTANGDLFGTLRAVVAEKGVVKWHTETPFTGRRYGWERNPRRSYYCTTIHGTRDSKPVTADVELVALDGQEWTLKEWSER